MDQSFGYNAQSRPEHFLGHDELLWMLTDIVAKGGNLLLNVGPRGDAQLPDAQVTRLEWLAEWSRPRGRDRRDAAVGTAGHDDRGGLRRALLRTRRDRLRVRARSEAHGDARRCARDAYDLGDNCHGMRSRGRNTERHLGEPPRGCR